MKLLLLRVLLSTLFFLVCSALPASCPTPACTGGSYATCVGSFVCTMQFPESCTCGNTNKINCAAACGVARPALQDCSGGGGNGPQR